MSRQIHKCTRGSLDLLLDTMCNAFGSIILIAILMVLISSETPDSSPGASEAPEKDHVERQIAAAEESIARLLEELARVPENPVASQVEDLRQRISDAKDVLSEAKKNAQRITDNSIVDVSASIAKHRQEEKKHRTRLTAINNEIEAIERRMDSIQLQIAQIGDEIKKLLAARTETIRLPKERSTSRDPTSIIFLYNEIFWMNYGGSRNTDALDWFSRDESVLVKPKRGMGWLLPRDTLEVEGIVREHSRNHLIACYVFPDSIDVFKKFRDMAYRHGADIGWSLEVKQDELVFSATGTSPKPQ
jgi:hypothetical protein